MEKKEIELYFGKKVRLFLKNGYKYHGFIISAGDDSLRLNDTFQSMVIIAYDQISLIEEMRE